MTPDAAAALARRLFVEQATHGCAETVFVVLKEAWGLPQAEDASAVAALNGGVAYSGGTCGALTGAAVASGLMAERAFPRRPAAKKASREAVAELMDRFAARFGALDCRALTGREIRTAEQHRAFIEDGGWRITCMAQVEFAVREMADLAGPGPGRRLRGGPAAKGGGRP